MQRLEQETEVWRSLADRECFLGPMDELEERLHAATLTVPGEAAGEICLWACECFAAHLG